MSARSVIGGGRKGKSPASKAKPTKSVKQFKPAVVFEKVFRSSVLIDLVELSPLFDKTTWDCVTKASDGGQMLTPAVYNKGQKQDIDAYIDPIPKSISKMRELLVAIYDAIVARDPNINVEALAALRLPDNMPDALRDSGDCCGAIRPMFVVDKMTNDVACETAMLTIIKRLAHVVALQIGYTKHAPLTALNVVQYCMLADLPSCIINLAKATIMQPKPKKAAAASTSTAAATVDAVDADGEDDDGDVDEEDANA